MSSFPTTEGDRTHPAITPGLFTSPSQGHMLRQQPITLTGLTVDDLRTALHLILCVFGP